MVFQTPFLLPEVIGPFQFSTQMVDMIRVKADMKTIKLTTKKTSSMIPNAILMGFGFFVLR